MVPRHASGRGHQATSRCRSPAPGISACVEQRGGRVAEQPVRRAAGSCGATAADEVTDRGRTRRRRGPGASAQRAFARCAASDRPHRSRRPRRRRSGIASANDRPVRCRLAVLQVSEKTAPRGAQPGSTPAPRWCARSPAYPTQPIGRPCPTYIASAGPWAERGDEVVTVQVVRRPSRVAAHPGRPPSVSSTRTIRSARSSKRRAAGRAPRAAAGTIRSARRPGRAPGGGGARTGRARPRRRRAATPTGTTRPSVPRTTGPGSDRARRPVARSPTTSTASAWSASAVSSSRPPAAGRLAGAARTGPWPPTRSTSGASAGQASGSAEVTRSIGLTPPAPRRRTAATAPVGSRPVQQHLADEVVHDDLALLLAVELVEVPRRGDRAPPGHPRPGHLAAVEVLGGAVVVHDDGPMPAPPRCSRSCTRRRRRRRRWPGRGSPRRSTSHRCVWNCQTWVSSWIIVDRVDAVVDVEVDQRVGDERPRVRVAA